MKRATMTTLAPNAFIGRKETPTYADLARALDSTKPLWDTLTANLAAQHGVDIQEWKCYSPKAGWSLRLKRGKRTILWMAPCPGHFRVMFILGDKAVQAAHQAGLSASVLRTIDEAEKYPEGTGIRLCIKSPKDIPTVMKLAVVKLKN